MNSTKATISKKRKVSQMTKAAASQQPLSPADTASKPTTRASKQRKMPVKAKPQPKKQSTQKKAAVKDNNVTLKDKSKTKPEEETKKEEEPAPTLTQSQRLEALTHCNSVDVETFAGQVKKEIEQKSRRAQDEVICPICQCPMFDNLDFTDLNSIRQVANNQKEGKIPSDYVVMMNRCKDHGFHKECLEAQLGSKSYLECSTCLVTYGVKTGDQPPGKLSWSREHFAVDGEKKGTKTWVITYEFPSGVHPETKKEFFGDGRVGYLPDTQDGREVLALLVLCFQRKLTFTVGFSVVRGRDNCIVWNGVHHKTRTSGGATRYGYPDPTYCNRVRQEMALKGVVFESDEHKDRLVAEVTSTLSHVEHRIERLMKNDGSDKVKFAAFANFKIPGLY